MKKVLTSIILFSLLSSCTHYYYIPATQNVPLMKEKNEFHITGGTCIGENDNIGEVQASFSPIKNGAILVNYLSVSGSNSSSNYESSGYGQQIELAAGYFKNISKKIIFEIYSGGGFSTQRHSYGPGFSNLKSDNLFIQPDIGYCSQGFELALSFKYNRNHVNFIEADDKLNRNAYNDLYTIQKNNVWHFIEPGITLKTGWKILKLQLQYVLSYGINDIAATRRKDHFSIGLQFVLAKSYIKKNQNEGH